MLARDVGDGRGPQPVTPDQWIAELILLKDAGHCNGHVGDDEESQEFARKVRDLNPDWQPGEVPKVPERPPEHPDRAAWRERLIRQRGAWAYTPDGTLKPDWLLAMGPKAWEAQQRKNLQAMLRSQARLAQLRRDGYWFDDQHRLQAPLQDPGRRIQAAVRAPRRRTVRRTVARTACGDPDSEPEQPLLAALPSSARIALEVAWLEVLGARHTDVRWTVRPGERGQRDTATTSGEILGPFTAPEDPGALLGRNGTAGAADGTNEDGVDGGGE
jgi:hypothetical protein